MSKRSVARSPQPGLNRLASVIWADAEFWALVLFILSMFIAFECHCGWFQFEYRFGPWITSELLILCLSSVVLPALVVVNTVWFHLQRGTMHTLRSWRDFLPLEVRQSFTLDCGADEAFDRCLVAFSKCASAIDDKVPNLDLVERKIDGQIGIDNFSIQIEEQHGLATVTVAVTNKDNCRWLRTLTNSCETISRIRLVDKFISAAQTAKLHSADLSKLKGTCRSGYHRGRRSGALVGAVAMAALACSIPQLTALTSGNLFDMQAKRELKIANLINWNNKEEVFKHFNNAVSNARHTPWSATLVSALRQRGYLNLYHKNANEAFRDLSEMLDLVTAQANQFGSRATIPNALVENEIDALFGLANAFVLKNDLEKSKKLLQEALSLADTNAASAIPIGKLHHLLGSIALAEHREEQALQHFLRSTYITDSTIAFELSSKYPGEINKMESEYLIQEGQNSVLKLRTTFDEPREILDEALIVLSAYALLLLCGAMRKYVEQKDEKECEEASSRSTCPSNGETGDVQAELTIIDPTEHLEPEGLTLDLSSLAKRMEKEEATC